MQQYLIAHNIQVCNTIICFNNTPTKHNTNALKLLLLFKIRADDTVDESYKRYRYIDTYKWILNIRVKSEVFYDIVIKMFCL